MCDFHKDTRDYPSVDLAWWGQRQIFPPKYPSVSHLLDFRAQQWRQHDTGATKHAWHWPVLWPLIFLCHRSPVRSRPPGYSELIAPCLCEAGNTQPCVLAKRNGHLQAGAWQAFSCLIVRREEVNRGSPASSLLFFIAQGTVSHIAPAHHPDWFPQHFLGDCHHLGSMSKLSHASKYIVIDSICNSSRDLALG